ncbi:hypothetical protein MYMA111404_03010 [Mycoplasma marinum]|uniref:CMP/dCMP-type deaminase domain-containing protein n=1 Tax=Mycoplasma marinum TaxID=1937190 RepID=A0A4R0XWC3_9MOLU|nr:hypothetical protein [Mycoplasma marinum]TCG11271.1 hypothetical protein C4B24_02390 [Mycoplasma marinum]
MSKKINKIYNEMKKKKPQGFPCFSVLDLDDVLSNVTWNEKGKINKQHLRHKNHAEFLSLEKIRNTKAKKIVIYQTFLPCFHCLNAIKQTGKKVTFIYLFDPWKKKIKKHWKGGKITFHRIQPTKQNQAFIDYNWELIKARYKKPSHKNSYKKISKLYGKFDNMK